MSRYYSPRLNANHRNLVQCFALNRIAPFGPNEFIDQRNPASGWHEEGCLRSRDHQLIPIESALYVVIRRKQKSHDFPPAFALYEITAHTLTVHLYRHKGVNYVRGIHL